MQWVVWMIGDRKPKLVAYDVENRSCNLNNYRWSGSSSSLGVVLIWFASRYTPGRPVDLMYHRFQKSITSSRNTWRMKSIPEPNLRESIIITYCVSFRCYDHSWIICSLDNILLSPGVYILSMQHHYPSYHNNELVVASLINLPQWSMSSSSVYRSMIMSSLELIRLITSSLNC